MSVQQQFRELYFFWQFFFLVSIVKGLKFYKYVLLVSNMRVFSDTKFTMRMNTLPIFLLDCIANLSTDFCCHSFTSNFLPFSLILFSSGSRFVFAFFYLHIFLSGRHPSPSWCRFRRLIWKRGFFLVWNYLSGFLWTIFVYFLTLWIKSFKADTFTIRTTSYNRSKLVDEVIRSKPTE